MGLSTYLMTSIHWLNIFRNLPTLDNFTKNSYAQLKKLLRKIFKIKICDPTMLKNIHNNKGYNLL